jgi:hypothetical protein
MKYTIPKYEFKKGGKAKVARSLFNKVKKPKAAKSVKRIKDKIDFTGVESLTFDEANAWIKANPDLRLGRGIDPNIGRPSYQNSGRIKHQLSGEASDPLKSYEKYKEEETKKDPYNPNNKRIITRQSLVLLNRENVVLMLLHFGD